MRIPTVDVCYHFLDTPPITWTEAWKGFLKELSPEQLTKMRKFLHHGDQLRYLIGRILIRRLFRMYGHPENASHHLSVSSFGRPLTDLPLDFNLTHSGQFVLCAGSTDCRVGIDTEQCKSIDFADFKSVMTPSQWDVIHTADNPELAFFHYWTMKESVIKADGRGLSRPLHEIEVVDMQVADEAMQWHLHKIEMYPGYPTYLTTDVPSVNVRLHRWTMGAEDIH